MRILRIGVILWLAGTIAIRLGGQYFLRPAHEERTVVLYIVSFVLMGALARAIFRRMHLESNTWPNSAVLLMLPTLLLDPFSCLFFPRVFPNIDPAAAGIFGGWMLIFCAGAAAGVLVKR